MLRPNWTNLAINTSEPSFVRPGPNHFKIFRLGPGPWEPCECNWNIFFWYQTEYFHMFIFNAISLGFIFDVILDFWKSCYSSALKFVIFRRGNLVIMETLRQYYSFDRLFSWKNNSPRFRTHPLLSGFWSNRARPEF